MKILLIFLALLGTAHAASPTYIYDSSGNPITATNGALNTNTTFVATFAGTTGAAVPGDAMYTGANKGGNLVGLKVGQQTMADSLACVLPSDQSAIPVTGTFWQATQPISATSLPLPTGAATEATLLSIDGKITAVDTGNVVISSGTVTVDQATAANLKATVNLNDGSGNALTSKSVGSSRALETSEVGFTSSEFVRRDYSSSSVSSAAYAELIASTGSEYGEIEIFDSSGQTLKLAIGSAGAEVDKFLIIPGGNGRIKYRIPSGSRVSIKAVSGTANAGEISMNLYGN